nr:zinc finger CCCH domain-containing protein 32-like isoform X1 [Ipomoea batatas]
MELYGQSRAKDGLQIDRGAVWAPVRSVRGKEESIRRLGLWVTEGYPERLGVSDCAYYMRTGFCGFGSKCRFNHPRGFGSVGLPQMRIWVYPERPGEPTCQYYLRTGLCKFGASCRFHHPRNAGGSLSNAPLNIYGFPLRPEEKECSYYLKTGHCKFGITCTFHHPQPAAISGQATAHPFYLTVQSLPGPSPEQYSGASSSFRVARHPFLPDSYTPSAYGPVLLHSGVVPVPNWSQSGHVIPALSSTPAFAGPYSPLHTTTGLSSCAQREKCFFPERPGQPECEYYKKTGNCKFGSSCKFHHPPDWVPPNSNCSFSPLGLPLRPGVQACCFYLRKGFCKFGGNCKFDHPMETVNYSPSASSSLTDAPYMLQPGFADTSFSRSRLPLPSSASVGFKLSHTAPPTSRPNMRSHC